MVSTVAIGLLLVWLSYDLTAGAELDSSLQVDLVFMTPEVENVAKVAAYIEFKNPTSRPLVINLAITTLGDCGLEFTALGPSGKAVSQNTRFLERRLTPYSRGDFHKIESGKVYRLAIKFNEWFDLQTPGSYYFQVAYWNRYSGQWLDESVWTGMSPKSAQRRLVIRRG